MCFLIERTLVLRSSEGNCSSEVPNVTSHKVSLVRRGIHQNPLDEIISILISRNYSRIGIIFPWGETV
jgi:hypothetical protein